jgi:hypothetical protein
MSKLSRLALGSEAQSSVVLFGTIEMGIMGKLIKDGIWKLALERHWVSLPLSSGEGLIMREVVELSMLYLQYLAHLKTRRFLVWIKGGVETSLSTGVRIPEK